MKGANALAEKIAKETPNSFIAAQFENMANPESHYQTTGPEIYEDMDGQIDYFVCAVGTGGTISGVGKYLKEKNKNIKVIGVEPAASPYITEGRAGPHKIQGIGAGFIPENLDLSLIDEVVTVSDSEAITYARSVARCEGLLVGISSGAALAAAVKLSRKDEMRGKRIVVILPDTGERYLSAEVF
jgi:cysteine synthase A